MTEKAEVPPKSEWKTHRVRVESIDTGFIHVRAPNPEAAREAAQSYLDHGEDVDLVAWEDPWNGGSFDVPEGEPREVDGEPEIEYAENEAGYTEGCSHPSPRVDAGLPSCGDCGNAL